ncbi:MAG: murein hydrolase activator EnvC [Reyranellaceae bacterium]
MARRLALGAALIALGTAPLAAQSPPAGRLSEVERQAEAERERAARAEKEAEAARKEAERLRGELIGAARQVQTGETALARLEKRKSEIDELIGERTAALSARRGQLAALLGALERLASRPPESLLAQPGAPDDTVRAGLLLRAMVPRIEAAAAQLRTELEDLASLREEAERNATQLRGATASLQGERQRLEALLSEKARAEQERRQEAQEGARQAEKLAAQARDLRELIEKLDAERKQREEAARRNRAGPAAKATIPPPPAGYLALAFTATRGKLPLPARGAVYRRFGEELQGQPSRGIVVETRRNAPVVAPHDGQVVYAGEFRGYGLVLILEHGEGYHFLLAGLSRIDCAAGQWVLAGEPVGVMGSAGVDSQRLYIELRRQGHPIDPLSWLVPDKDKVG